MEKNMKEYVTNVKGIKRKWNPSLGKNQRCTNSEEKQQSNLFIIFKYYFSDVSVLWKTFLPTRAPEAESSISQKPNKIR